MRHSPAEKIRRTVIETMERHPERRWAPSEMAEAIDKKTPPVRAAFKKLEDKGWLRRVSHVPILRFMLAGCRKVFQDGDTGANIRCTTKDYHAEHEVNGYKQVRVPVGNVVGE